MKKHKSSLDKVKSIALVAHDSMKEELCEWALKNKSKLSAHKLFATGTTGFILEKQLNLNIHKFISGPLGGDQQIGAKISEGDIDILIFFWDPFEQLPHDPDVKALLRIATVWNIPVATNSATDSYIEERVHGL